ncbi:MAG: hypothetical protein AAFQ65_06140 [Myxococcota bacterium]
MRPGYWLEQSDCRSCSGFRGAVFCAARPECAVPALCRGFPHCWERVARIWVDGDIIPSGSIYCDVREISVLDLTGLFFGGTMWTSAASLDEVVGVIADTIDNVYGLNGQRLPEQTKAYLKAITAPSELNTPFSEADIDDVKITKRSTNVWTRTWLPEQRRGVAVTDDTVIFRDDVFDSLMNPPNVDLATLLYPSSTTVAAGTNVFVDHLSLLAHEMVHIAQRRAMGDTAFVSEYLNDLAVAQGYDRCELQAEYEAYYYEHLLGRYWSGLLCSQQAVSTQSFAAVCGGVQELSEVEDCGGNNPGVPTFAQQAFWGITVAQLVSVL